MKKILAILILATLVTGGAFAQLMLGVTGDLHMDETMTASEIQQRFETGQGLFYGLNGELVLGKLGFGVLGTFSFYTDYMTNIAFMDYDVAGYVSYHLFGGRGFIDPFGEFGVGFLASDYANSDDKAMYGMSEDDPLSASLFWYGAVGLGVNLGPIGVFGKLAYNAAIQQHLKGTDMYGQSYDIPFYGYWDPMANGGYGGVIQYVPKYRFTLGAKLIL